MSLFLDEKTKEEKFRKYCHENNCDNTPFRLTAYLAGWNECEKHVRESASVGFDEWVGERLKELPNESEGRFLLSISETLGHCWQACSVAKDREIAEKDKEIKRLKEECRKELSVKDKRIAHLESEVTRVFEPTRQFWNKDNETKIQSLESQLQHSKEWFSEAEERIKLLESQLKERDEALIELYDCTRFDWWSDFTGIEEKYKSLINQIKESRK